MYHEFELTSLSGDLGTGNEQRRPLLAGTPSEPNLTVTEPVSVRRPGLAGSGEGPTRFVGRVPLRSGVPVYYGYRRWRITAQRAWFLIVLAFLVATIWDIQE